MSSTEQVNIEPEWWSISSCSNIWEARKACGWICSWEPANHGRPKIINFLPWWAAQEIKKFGKNNCLICLMSSVDLLTGRAIEVTTWFPERDSRGEEIWWLSGLAYRMVSLMDSVKLSVRDRFLLHFSWLESLCLRRAGQTHASHSLLPWYSGWIL